MTTWNFSSGPAILPKPVIEKAAAAILDFKGSGIGVLECSHRSKLYEPVVASAESRLRKLMGISDDYAVLFLQGGASTQFAQVPQNILASTDVADYTDTGTWASKAIKEAKLYGKVNVIASSKEADGTYKSIPKDLKLTPGAKYLHVTSNNTIFGTQLHAFPDVAVPLVSDMSSDICSRVVDVNKFGVIYAGAQKNLGPSGVTVVIVRKDLLGKVDRQIPTMMDYRTHIEAGSMFNTPPAFGIFVLDLVLEWLEGAGGIAGMQKINDAKAAKLYAEIDRNPLFAGTVAVEDRSRMNVCFVPLNKDHEEPFKKLCLGRGMVDFTGHRSVGGFRASIYNAMPEAGIDAMIEAMRDFEKSNG
ncbi:MAG: 3-phosphoserine/phosphohydroxythreonine transaminase [Fibrobacterota bacterium]|nr:3-phosphoserine/phosphohydroxythreonine transaminase [Fibrobacterota bacterium]QQS05582.1 MAG: 3-phosphoserine/phosphohydroxythreonine transaminase [Fibrobacterota bacterium]